MNNPFQKPSGSSKIENEAARWMWRLDRGLSATEQDAFFEWLGSDPRHSEVLARHRARWKRLDKIADWRPEHARRPNPDLLAPPSKSRRRHPLLMAGLAAAAGIAICLLALVLFQDPADRVIDQGLDPGNRMVLIDGSTIKLNENADITVLYTPGERRIRLERGEAFFMVAKDPNRPFIVEASGIEVRAVGTAFNLRMENKTLGVLVAEGTVSVTPNSVVERAPEEPVTPRAAILEASQQTTIPLGVPLREPPAIDPVTRGDVREALAWQHGVVSFDATPLREIVEELNLLNGTQLIIEDAATASMRFSGTFRSDNVEGFVRLLEVGFGVRAEMVGPDRIVLRAI